MNGFYIAILIWISIVLILGYRQKKNSAPKTKQSQPAHPTAHDDIGDDPNPYDLTDHTFLD